VSARDWLEAGWHAGLLVLALPAMLRLLLGHRWLRLALAAMVLLGLAYHVAVVESCHAYLAGRGGWLCTWG